MLNARLVASVIMLSILMILKLVVTGMCLAIGFALGTEMVNSIRKRYKKPLKLTKY